MDGNALKRAFVQRFGGTQDTVRLFFAPGRVNLIGEHVDYCGGPVLPAALGMGALCAARVREDSVMRLAATSLPDVVQVGYDKLGDNRFLPWGSYQLGVAYMLLQDGYRLRGCDLLYHIDVPFGSGLSSSAAIEVVTAYALLALSGALGRATPRDKSYMAVASQRAENDFVGVNCGIMDQFACAMGRRGHAILLQCDTLAYDYIPLALGEYRLIIMNSNKKHALGASKYNERRQETERGLASLQHVLPGIACLADVTPQQLARYEGVLPDDTVAARVRHVVEECDRVRRAARCLRDGDIAAFGALLDRSHASLRTLYEVTGPELDALVDAARRLPGVLGARMTGAGFGGCAIALVHESRVQAFADAVDTDYTARIGYPPTFYPSEIGDGVREISV